MQFDSKHFVRILQTFVLGQNASKLGLKGKKKVKLAHLI